MAESMGLEGRPHPYLRRGDVLDVPTSGRGHLPYPPSGRALYAQRVVTRPRQGLPWSPSDLARAPLLGGHFTALPFCGFALARHRPEEREQCLYHSGRAPLARFALPDEILLTVFDALVPAATWRPEKPVPDAFWWNDHKLLDRVLRSCWIESFAWSSAIDAVVATRPLAEVSKSWRDALRKTMKLRRELLGQYKRERIRSGSTIYELQNLFHSNFPEHVAWHCQWHWNGDVFGSSHSDSETEEGP